MFLKEGFIKKLRVLSKLLPAGTPLTQLTQIRRILPLEEAQARIYAREQLRQEGFINAAREKVKEAVARSNALGLEQEELSLRGAQAQPKRTRVDLREAERAEAPTNRTLKDKLINVIKDFWGTVVKRLKGIIDSIFSNSSRGKGGVMPADPAMVLRRVPAEELPEAATVATQQNQQIAKRSRTINTKLILLSKNQPIRTMTVPRTDTVVGWILLPTSISG